MGRDVIYALCAVDQAMRDANLIEYDGDKDRFGVSIGSGMGGVQTIYDTSVDLEKSGENDDGLTESEPGDIDSVAND